MTTKRFAILFGASLLALGVASVPAAQAAVVATGSIVNSSGATRRCVCSVRCVSPICVVGAPAAPGFCTVPAGTMVNGQVVSCSGIVPVAGDCNCAVDSSSKKVRLLACMEGDPGGVTPQVCSNGY